MPNINSKELKNLGITIQDVLDAVMKSHDDTIILKKKKKKSKKKKNKNKKMNSLHPLQNNKPNFTSQNQIGSGGGAIGGTSFNPLYQRSAPPVTTTVINTPSSGGQNEITRLLIEDKKQNDRINELDKNMKISHLSLLKELDNGFNTGINYLGTLINNQTTSPKIQEIDEFDNVGFNTASYHNPLSRPSDLVLLQQNTRKMRELSDQLSGTFRNPPQPDRNDRFGVTPINNNYDSSNLSYLTDFSTISPSESGNSYHGSDNNYKSDSIVGGDIIDSTYTDSHNFGYDDQRELQLDAEQNQDDPYSPLPVLPPWSELKKAREQLRTLEQKNEKVGGDADQLYNELEQQKQKYYDDTDNENDIFLPTSESQTNKKIKKKPLIVSQKKPLIVSQKENEDVINPLSQYNVSSTPSKLSSKSSEENKNIDQIDDGNNKKDDMLKWTKEDEEEEQRAIEELRKKKEEKKQHEIEQREQKLKDYAEKVQRGEKPRGKAPVGWEKYYVKPTTNLSSKAIQSQPKFTNNNSKLTQQNEEDEGDNDIDEKPKRSKRIAKLKEQKEEEKKGGFKKNPSKNPFEK